MSEAAHRYASSTWSRERGLELMAEALQRLQLHAAQEGLFEAWLAKKGKLGGQHKIPRLSNSREFMEEILAMLSKH